MIFLDLDGTLLNLWPRYHAVFVELTGIHITLSTYIKLACFKTAKKRLTLYYSEIFSNYVQK